jgi:hypothetical protein
VEENWEGEEEKASGVGEGDGTGEGRMMEREEEAACRLLRIVSGDDFCLLRSRAARLASLTCSRCCRTSCKNDILVSV